MPDLNDLKESLANLTDSIIRTERQSHAGIVVTITSILEYDLERSIKWKFRPLNKAMKKRLFDSAYAPIGTFAAKIDIAYALDITSDAVHQELNKMRKIRNEFAHTTKPLSLDTEPIKALFLTLARPPGITGSYLQQFAQCGVVLDDYLEAFLIRMGETEDLRVLEQKPLEVVEATAHLPSRD
jgi:hypothetical protein